MPPSAHKEDCPGPIHRAASRREAFMSWLALAFLVVTAFILHHYERTPHDIDQGTLLGWLIFILWLPIFIEALLGYWWTGDYTWPASRRLLLIWLLPPYRLVLATHPSGRCMWLPLLGWQYADNRCFERLDRAFSIPMLFIALMILPILGIEIFGARYVESYPELALLLDLATAVIWVAFTVEFIVMTSVTEKKLPYIAHHWLNLVIILLPFLAFLRGFQVARLARMGKVARALKIYRLRGLGVRAWQGAVALELIEKALLRDPEARLRHLKERLKEQEEASEILRDRIAVLERENGNQDQPVVVTRDSDDTSQRQSEPPDSR